MIKRAPEFANAFPTLNSQPDHAARSPEQQTEWLRQYVVDRLHRLGFGQSEVALVSRRRNVNSAAWEFAVRGTDRASFHVLLKMPRIPAQAVPAEEQTLSLDGGRPRLFEPADAWTRAQLEYAALIRIYRQVLQLDDPRFGAVRPLGFIADSGAILMERSSARSLKHLLTRRTRVNRSVTSPELLDPLRNTGAWLRMFHESPLPPHAQPQYDHRDTVPQSIYRFCDYLSKLLGRSAYFARLADAAADAADRLLPATAPLATAHCDFAPRNILVSSSSRITVVDTAARWQTPVYMDIAYFLVNLKHPLPQIYSCGCAISRRDLASYENAFLRGYFGDAPIPWSVLRVYEIQAIADRWAAISERLAQQKEGGKFGQPAAARLQLGLVARYFRNRIAHLMRDLGER